MYNLNLLKWLVSNYTGEGLMVVIDNRITNLEIVGPQTKVHNVLSSNDFFFVVQKSF